MAKSMTPAKRHAIRAKYEEQAKARKDVRLGIRPTKKGKRK